MDLPESDESNSHPPIEFICDYFQCHPPVCSYTFQAISFLQFSEPHLFMHFRWQIIEAERKCLTRTPRHDDLCESGVHGVEIRLLARRFPQHLRMRIKGYDSQI